MHKSRLFLLTLGHFCVDSYATLLAPVLPLVNQRLGLSLTYAGLLGTIGSLVNVSQPLLGIWADMMKRRYLVLAGLGMAALFHPMLGIAPTYWTLILVLALGSFGVAAFHPQVFSLAGELSGERRPFGLSLFIFGGTMGLGLTPFWMPYFATNFGLEKLPIVTLPGLLALFLIYRFIPLDAPPHPEPNPLEQDAAPSSPVLPLVLITAVVILRSVTSVGFGFYLAVLGTEQGLSLVASGGMLGLYNIAGVLGGLGAGYLAERVNAKPLVWMSIFLAAPTLYFFIGTGGLFGYLLLVAGGAMIMASNPLLVAQAQELAPKNSGLASSLPLGFSWGMASLSLAPIGYFADQIGVAETLKYLALLPIFTAVLALFLPARPPKPQS
ncbi:MAG: MFS transporter [Candidatus Latescibacteria bacterium]|nr:MFS transporter [Candidatus Latescibacterota bacterium]